MIDYYDSNHILIDVIVFSFGLPHFTNRIAVLNTSHGSAILSLNINIKNSKL